MAKFKIINGSVRKGSKVFKQGTEVELNAEDAKRLIENGIVEDPKAKTTNQGDK
jgi:hypothetical protein